MNTNNGKHSFLFWLTIPVIILWMSISYVIGFVREKPEWYKKPVETKATDVKSYMQEYRQISNNLDQAFITFWFDDAWLSQYLEAYPILKSYNYPATVAVPTDAIETPNYMNWSQLRVLRDNGWEISDHSRKHDCKMNTWEESQISEELRMSKLILWKNRLSADIFVTPCGVDSDLMRLEAKKMFIGYRTVDPGFNNPTDFDFYNLKVKNIDNQVKIEEAKDWIKYAKENRLWLIIVFHKIGENVVNQEDEQFNTKLDDFKNIVEYVKSSEIQVIVPSQIMSAVII
ncbi:MAG: hypothetical protein US60_C0020G0013 [Microgenomates group bacterium GW2011_GWC1_37_8]|nr:MAG: hypothetical protein US60_C0020G0013 [Microgenomates group bacterium GW2011_GWC1_37_8]